MVKSHLIQALYYISKAACNKQLIFHSCLRLLTGLCYVVSVEISRTSEMKLVSPELIDNIRILLYTLQRYPAATIVTV